ncbi:hypothetical protein REPUB_Repub09cG0161200 [Reevesia pubescens]
MPEREERSGNKARKEHLLKLQHHGGTLDVMEGHLTWGHFAYDLSIMSTSCHLLDLIRTCLQLSDKELCWQPLQNEPGSRFFLAKTEIIQQRMMMMKRKE